VGKGTSVTELEEIGTIRSRRSDRFPTRSRFRGGRSLHAAKRFGRNTGTGSLRSEELVDAR